MQLLDPEPVQSTANPQDDPGLRTSSQDVPAGVQMEAELSSGHLGDTTNAAAVAAAAVVAAAAPLIKVNLISDQFTELLQEIL